MAQLHKVQVKEEIKSSPDKFYSFYRNNMGKLADIFPDKFSNVWLVEGNDNCVGSVKHWSYVVDGIQSSANIKIDAIDDENKTISFTFLEGDFKKFYNSISTKLEVKKGFASWNYEYEEAYEDAPSFDGLANFGRQIMIKGVDDYLFKN